jgi:hypothetical protein
VRAPTAPTPLLSAFVDAISWRPGASILPVLAAHLDVLADRTSHLVETAPAPERAVLVDQLEGLERDLEGGALSALTWPPVSAALLGRAPRPTTAGGLATLLLAEVAAVPPFGSVAPTWREAAWLTADAPGRPVAPDGWVVAAAAVPPAWEVLGRCGDDVADFVRSATRVVIPRTDDPAVTGSWSTDELVGASLVVNADRQEPASLAASLVHEAVHHGQGMVEVVHPFVVDRALVAGRQRLPSPWTGVPLTGRSLLAACFVWYSLAAFWNRAGPAVGWGLADAGIRRAAVGFLDGDPAAAVRRMAWALDPEVVDLVAELQATVRERWGDA